MTQKILMPLDGSKVGEAALPVIEELVAKLSLEKKVEVILFQSASALSHWIFAGEATAKVPYTGKELEMIKKEAQKYLDQAADNLRSRGVAVQTSITFGSAAEEILRAADEFKVDLIAMSTHGRSGLSRWAFGSVTDKVLREAKMPVITVKAPREPEKK